MLLLSKYALDLINHYVDGELTSPNVEQNVICFRQCIKFWQLTEDLSGDDIDLIRERLTFKMLGFVDHENPLLRYSAKNWLTQSINNFQNILDVVFIALLQNTEFVFKPEKAEVSYINEYPTAEVTLCIKHLKNMLIMLGNLFCSFIMTTKISQKILPYIPKLGEKKLTSGATINYQDLLAVICLRYIEGDVKEEGTTFHMRNLSVKATACEFLEMVLKNHPNKDTISQISFYLLDPLSVVLKRAVEKDEGSILIQILSVLKVILYNSGFETNKAFQEKYFFFLQKKAFLDTLIQGLNSKHLYIVIEFKDFICSLVTVTAEHMRHPQLTEIVNRVLQGYYSLISANNPGFVRIRKQASRQVTKAM